MSTASGLKACQCSFNNYVYSEANVLYYTIAHRNRP